MLDGFTFKRRSTDTPAAENCGPGLLKPDFFWLVDAEFPRTGVVAIVKLPEPLFIGVAETIESAFPAFKAVSGMALLGGMVEVLLSGTLVGIGTLPLPAGVLPAPSEGDVLPTDTVVIGVGEALPPSGDACELTRAPDADNPSDGIEGEVLLL